MEVISGFGTKIQIIASETFPLGFTLTQWSDDGDFFDSPVIDMMGTGMGGNGDLVAWKTANPISAKVTVIPNSVGDNFLSALANANLVGKDKRTVNDQITMVVFLPSGRIMSYQKGVLTSAMIGFSIASEGRLKTKEYSFMFESFNQSL